MTAQLPDEVRFQHRRYAITAVDGKGLFDPTEHGIEPGPLSTACWRGFICTYEVRDGDLLLHRVEIGRPQAGGEPSLFGGPPRVAGETARHPGALRYLDLYAPVTFTGRLLLGNREVRLGYLNMGFHPAWLFDEVLELTFDAGRLAAAVDRSAELARVRQRLGIGGLGPRAGEDRAAWISRAFSLSYDYSWPPS